MNKQGIHGKRKGATVPSVKPAPAPGKPLSGLNLLLPTAVLFITFLAFLPSLQNGLLKTWDDQAYITHNDLITSLSPGNIIRIFREDKGLYANYHPLTTLSLAVNHSISGDSPFGYHLTNLFLHLLNTLLVFLFIYLLTGKKVVPAAIVSLLFGIHPMHVESVAWISERKDVLYTLFFLASLISWQIYLKRKNDPQFYLLSLFLFACSLLSKAMAAPLPLVLFLIDYISVRKLNVRIFLEKIPFFLFSIGFGILAIHIQASSNATSSDLFSLSGRILHACYGFTIYILKLIIPFRLSAFYPYPYPLVNSAWILNHTPPVFYFTLFISLAILVLVALLMVKPGATYRMVAFSLLFYSATIVLVLQFIPVGRAIMADRYVYLAAIGIFILPGLLADHFYRKKRYRVPVMVCLIVYCGTLAFMTFQRCKVWKNDETLWTDVIEKYPGDNRIILPIANRANYFYIENRMPEALKDYLLAASMNQNDDVVLEKIGRIYGKEMHNIDSALIYFTRAYEKNTQNLDAISGLAIVYGIKGDLGKSLQFSLAGLKIKGDDPPLLYNIGITYKNLGEKEKGEEFLQRAFRLDPSLKH